MITSQPKERRGAEQNLLLVERANTSFFYLLLIITWRFLSPQFSLRASRYLSTALRVKNMIIVLRPARNRRSRNSGWKVGATSFNVAMRSTTAQRSRCLSDQARTVLGHANQRLRGPGPAVHHPSPQIYLHTRPGLATSTAIRVNILKRGAVNFLAHRIWRLPQSCQARRCNTPADCTGITTMQRQVTASFWSFCASSPSRKD